MQQIVHFCHSMTMRSEKCNQQNMKMGKFFSKTKAGNKENPKLVLQYWKTELQMYAKIGIVGKNLVNCTHEQANIC